MDGKVSTLTSAIESETTRAVAAEDGIKASVNTEVVRAKAAEQNLADAIEGVSNEVANVKAAQTATASALTEEVNRAKAKEADVESKVTTETARATAAENKIATDLTTEVSRAKDAEKALSDKIDVINGDSTVIGSIAHAVEDAKHYTDDEVSNLEGVVNKAIAEEVARAKEAESAIRAGFRVENETLIINMYG
ncbi:MAG: hypothetical protein HDS49_04765 [Bacteroides sp.]|nr:hypothetical protein [Bacteroides sp.]